MPRIEIAAAKREAFPDDDPLVVGFYGQDFTCSGDLDQWALMEMAGADADNDMAIMSAFYRFLQSIFIAADWERFRQVCRDNKLGVEDLQPLITGIAEAVAARPTQRSSASPPGPGPITAKSRVVSLSPDTISRSA